MPVRARKLLLPEGDVPLGVVDNLAHRAFGEVQARQIFGKDDFIRTRVLRDEIASDFILRNALGPCLPQEKTPVGEV